MTNTNIIATSRALSKILRHGAEKAGILIRSDGFCKFDDLVKYSKLRHITIELLQEIVAKDEKGRFTLELIEEEWHIRANQGHSMASLDKVDMKRIVHHSEIPTVVHGTSLECWSLIKTSGLSRMRRLHIHFATGLLSDPDVRSGMRKSASVFIYIDAERAMRDGIVFFKSANNVVLSSGIDGVIAPIYFWSVTGRNGERLQ